MKKALNIDIVDLHTHILPNTDHGSDSIETSLVQLAKAKEAGVNRIIVSPHFYPNSHTVEGYIRTRNEAYKNLLPHLTEDLPEIKLGAEVLVCHGIENLPELPELYIQGTKTLLLELPFADFSEDYCDSVYSLTRSGVDVILVHAERYPVSYIEKMISNGAKLQLNTNALSRFFAPSKYYEWIDRGVVYAIGTDIHGVDKRYYRSFVKAVKRMGDRALVIKEKSDAIWNKAEFYEVKE